MSPEKKNFHATCTRLVPTCTRLDPVQEIKCSNPGYEIHGRLNQHATEHAPDYATLAEGTNWVQVGTSEIPLVPISNSLFFRMLQFVWVQVYK